MKDICRSIWLRQGGLSNTGASGKWHCRMVSAIGQCCGS